MGLESRFRAAYVAEFGNAYVKRSLDLDLIYTGLPGFSEAGAGALNLNVASSNKVVFAASPMVELGQTWRCGRIFRAARPSCPTIRGASTRLSRARPRAFRRSRR
jgi:hypothetical protein